MFDDARNYMKEYRENRHKALSNMQRSKWFCTPAGDMTALLAKFDSDAENAAWEGLYKGTSPNLMRMEAWRLKVHFLASTRQDIRTQFVVGEDNVPRTALDHDRHNYSTQKASLALADIFQRYIEALSKGAK